MGLCYRYADRVNPILRAIGTAVGALALVTAVVAACLHALPSWGSKWSALVSATPILSLAALAAIAAFLLVRRRRWAAVSVLAAAVLIWAQAPLFVADDVTNDGPRVRVLTSNITLGLGDIDDLAAAVARDNVDILMIEELTTPAESAAVAALGTQFPYSFTRPGPGGSGVGVFARYPLRGGYELPGAVLRTSLVLAELPGYGTVQLAVVHPMPPWPGSNTRWKRELKQLELSLGQVPADYPVIAAGDYNATYDHREFRALLTGGYRDAAEQVGAGIVWTYPTDKPTGPLIGIDHVLLRDAQAVRLYAVDIADADHRALFCEVALPKR